MMRLLQHGWILACVLAAVVVGGSSAALVSAPVTPSQSTTQGLPDCSVPEPGPDEAAACAKEVLGPLVCPLIAAPLPEPLVSLCAPTIIPFDAVDPPMAHTLIETPVRLDPGAPDPSDVRLIGPKEQEVTVDWAQDGESVDIAVPPELEAGAWDVRVHDASGAIYEAVDGLTIVEDLSVPIAAFDPATMTQGIDATATVFGPSDLNPGEHGFMDGALLYLSPATGGLATDLDTTFIDERRLEVTVPGTTAAGDYDILVMNPDMSAGFLLAGLTIA